MNIHALLTSGVYFKGKKKDHKPKSIFDSGFVCGFLGEKLENVSWLHKHFGSVVVETSTLEIVYPELEKFKSSKSKFCILEVLSKYGDINEIAFKKFKTKKDMIEFIDDFSGDTDDTKWCMEFYVKNSEKPIKQIYLSL